MIITKETQVKVLEYYKRNPNEETSVLFNKIYQLGRIKIRIRDFKYKQFLSSNNGSLISNFIICIYHFLSRQ